MGDSSHIMYSVEKGIAIVRFRYRDLRDFEEYDVIGREIDAAVGAEDVRSVILNFDVLEYMGSRLVGIVAALGKRLSGEGRKLVVCRMRPEPLRVFQICKLDTIIPVFASEQDARAALLP